MLKVKIDLFTLLFVLLGVLELIIQLIHIFEYLTRLLVTFLNLAEQSGSYFRAGQSPMYSFNLVCLVVLFCRVKEYIIAPVVFHGQVLELDQAFILEVSNL